MIHPHSPNQLRIGIVGLGYWGPNLARVLNSLDNCVVTVLCDRDPDRLKAFGQKYPMALTSIDAAEVMTTDHVDAIIISTPTKTHFQLAKLALSNGVHTFVEKPLALNLKELETIDDSYRKSSGSLMIGFNRRFSPHTQKIKSLVGDAPMNIIATMNAGKIPSDVWVHDMLVGGGRIIGEACHYLDLIVFLTGSRIKSVCMNAMGENPSENTDNASILLKMENGSSGVINYFSNGAKSYAKERLEVFSQEKVLIMDNFIKTSGYGVKGFSKLKTKLDKGHKSQFGQIVEKIKQGSVELIPYEDLINVTKASFAAIESLKQGAWINLK